ncbi:hypothetical protein GGQ94_002080 [Petrimonas sulfuriphila]
MQKFFSRTTGEITYLKYSILKKKRSRLIRAWKTWVIRQITDIITSDSTRDCYMPDKRTYLRSLLRYFALSGEKRGFKESPEKYLQ